MKKSLCIVCFFLSSFFAFAQVDIHSELYTTILEKDSLLFSVGFNTCNLQQFEQVLSDRLTFYHDKNGMWDKTQLIADLKTGICNTADHRQVKRFLVKESTGIFPLYKNGVLYGAIQEGEHTFSENGEPSGIARFTHIWQLENGEWKLTAAYSFDHQEYTAPVSTGAPVFDTDTGVEKWLQENNIPVVGIGVIENGRLQQVEVYGELSKGRKAPYNTLFNVASLTKPITAMVALKLISAGKWKLDEPLYKYWTDPDIAGDPRSKLITTRHILSHQTGFPNWRGMTEDKKLAFAFDPGTGYQYSGEGFEYLRKALEKKFRRSLQSLADELIFQPLQMYDTRYAWDAAIDTLRLAPGYDAEGNVYATVKNTTPNAADDLLTTVEDYGKFLVSVMNGEGLSGEIWNEMIRNQVASTRGKHFGLGFEIYDLGDGHYALSHGGSDKGVQTIVFIFPKTRNGLLIFTSSDTGTRVYEPLIRQYLGTKGEKIIDIETR